MVLTLKKGYILHGESGVLIESGQIKLLRVAEAILLLDINYCTEFKFSKSRRKK